MTLINGRVVGINQREFSLRTGSDEESHGGGMIYEVDPAAVAHFKAVLASQPPRKPQAVSSQRQKQSGRLDADLQRKVNELAERARARAAAQAEVVETKELDVAKPEKLELTETAVREAHGRFTRGESVKALAAELGVSWQSLRAQFRQYGLSAGRQEAGKSQPVRTAAKVETAVVPMQATAVAASTAHGPTPPTDLREQLGVIQELLSLAEAQSVTLRGKICVDLHAEVAF
ncbi:MAG: hypothetical protein KBE23_09740 [Chloroflexi bacterium]|nr:hypothetical protein [Chloroflexota bacterium]MBP7043014.1 hypothetical protein [Chloroflexota bacterium]